MPLFPRQIAVLSAPGPPRTHSSSTSRAAWRNPSAARPHSVRLMSQHSGGPELIRMRWIGCPSPATDGDYDERSIAAVDCRGGARWDSPRAGGGPGTRRSRTVPDLANTPGIRRSAATTAAAGTAGCGVHPGRVGSVLPEMLAGLGTPGRTIPAAGKCAREHLDGRPVFAMPRSTTPVAGTALSVATAATACQSVVRAGRRQTLRLLPRRGVLQPSGAARLLRPTQLVPHHRGPTLDASLRSQSPLDPG